MWCPYEMWVAMRWLHSGASGVSRVVGIHFGGVLVVLGTCCVMEPGKMEGALAGDDVEVVVGVDDRGHLQGEADAIVLIQNQNNAEEHQT